MDIYETGCEFHWKYQINTLKQINTIQDVLEYIRKERGDEIVGRIRKWRTRLNRTVRPTDKLKNIKCKFIKFKNYQINLNNLNNYYHHFWSLIEEINELIIEIGENLLIIKKQISIEKTQKSK